MARWQQEQAGEPGEAWEEGEEEDSQEEWMEVDQDQDQQEEDGDGEETGDDVALEDYDTRKHRPPPPKERVRVHVRASPPCSFAPSAATAASASPSPDSTAAAGGGGAGGGGWYLGKLTGRVLRRGLLALVGEEEAQRRRDGAPVVARLRVAFKGVRGLKGALNPYLEVICEGTRRVVKPSRFREEGEAVAGGAGGGGASLDPEWGEAALSFAVTDITTNVHVLLLDKVTI